MSFKIRKERRNKEKTRKKENTMPLHIPVLEGTGTDPQEAVF
jgi:hypothetical protein